MTGAPDAADVRSSALPLSVERDLDPLLERIGDARFVLVGEASHGTHEYYAWRAALTRRLLTEKGFAFVAVEGDWPDCAAVNRAVTLAPGAPDPVDVLRDFERWPTWMWANTVVADFVRWLRELNATRRPAARVGFYGLDVYSLWDSLHATLGYLREHRPEDLGTALEAVRCFEPYAEDPQAYALSTRLVPEGCETEVVSLLRELRSAAARDGALPRDATFDAEQNALVAAGAEAYYRAMVRGGPESWNVRDRHMTETLERLVHHHGDGARAVVWEHNTHVGDARWTDMAAAGMVNVGQLVRELHGPDVVIVGFGSHEGSVTASGRWGGPTTTMRLPPARAGSVEDVLHRALGADPATADAALLLLDGDASSWAAPPREHRAVGVVYDPAAEHWGNYVPTVLDRRYDAFVWVDRTSALEPLAGVHAEAGEPATWPSGR